MRVISIAIQKGGSGKTTTAINLAAALRIMEFRVLLIDLDPQSNLTQALGLRDDQEPSIYHQLKLEAFGKKSNLLDLITNTDGQDVVPASLDLAASEWELINVYGRELILKHLLKPLQSKYDFVIIDCPPAISLLTVNALVASEFVLMPVQAEYLPLKGVGSFLSHFDQIKEKLNPQLALLGLVVTRFDSHKIMNRQVLANLEERFGEKVFATRIRNNISLSQAQEAGLSIFSYDASTHGARDYFNLGREVLERLMSSVGESGARLRSRFGS